METFIHGQDMDMFGENNDPFFSLSQFDLELQQQAQAVIQQQQQQINQNQQQQQQLQLQLQQQEQQQQQQREVQALWQDFDRYLPLECQPFMVTESLSSTTIENNNDSNNDNNNTNNNNNSNSNNDINNDMNLNGHMKALYEQLSPPFSANNSFRQMFEVSNKYGAGISPPQDFDITPIVHSQWTNEDLIKQEYPSPDQHSYTSSPQQPALLVPSMTSPLQQQQQQLPKNTMPLTPPNACAVNNADINHSTCTNSIATNTTTASAVSTPLTTVTTPTTATTTTTTPLSVSQSPPAMAPNVADIIARINWDAPTLSSYADANKVPIQRLKPSPNGSLPLTPASGATATTLTSSGTGNPGGKQKKTAHNAIERRYRNNINDRITELKNAVPALLHAKPKDRSQTTQSNKRHRLDDDDDDIGDDGEEYLDGVAVATKLNKATILRKATEYINHLKRTGDDMKRENDSLQHLLAQLPGGNEVLAHYQVQKVQREQMMQRQLVLERQLMKQEQQNRKKAANKRKRTRRQSNNDEDYDDGSLSSNSGDNPHTPTSDSGLSNNRVFMALFMAISFFSSSPLTTPAGSEQVNNHHHVSRTASEQMNAASMPTANESYNTYDAMSKHSTNSWISMDDGWSVLRLVLFIACLIQLLFPYFKLWVFGHSFRVRRITTHSKSRHRRSHHPRSHRTGKNKRLDFGNKTTPSMSPGDEKCMQMYQLLVKLLLTEHDDTTVRISSKSKFGLLWSLGKEMTVFTARHVFGYDIACVHRDDDEDEMDDDLDDSEWDQRQLRRWSQVFKWIKLNECECLGGNPFMTRLGMIYHSLRMLNLVDALEEDVDYDEDDDLDQQRKQLSSMRARAYATAAIQVVLAIPYAFFATRVADYLWGLAMWDANEEDTWACLTEDDQEDDLISVLSTKPAWIETLDVIRNQISTWTLVTTSTSRTTKSLGLSLSANAPALVPTAILSNLYLLDRLESDFRSLIDGMVMITPTSSGGAQQNPSTTMFFAYASSLSLKDDSRRVADWFTLVGAAVEALWRRDVDRAEQSMMTLVQRVPRAMIVPGFSKKKARQGELDAIAKQQVVHMLAGATLLLKQDNQGVKELEIAESLRQRKSKRSLATTNELEATHVEGRVMALAEFAVMLVGLEAWICTWQQQASKLNDNTIIHVDNNNVKSVASSGPTIEETNEQVRLITLSLRRMVRRPALAGLETQQILIDRLSRIGRFVDEQSHQLGFLDHDSDNDNNVDDDSAYEHSDPEETNIEDDSLEHGHFGLTEQDLLIRRTEKALAILHGV